MQSLKSFSRLKASSLLESVIAIAIISICILVAFTIYLNVLSSKKSIAYFNAKHKVEDWTEDIVRKQDYGHDTFKAKNFIIEKKSKINEDNNNVLLSFSIKINNRTYIIEKVVKYTNDNEN